MVIPFPFPQREVHVTVEGEARGSIYRARACPKPQGPETREDRRQDPGYQKAVFECCASSVPGVVNLDVVKAKQPFAWLNSAPGQLGQPGQARLRWAAT